MNTLKVALLQLTLNHNLEENLEKGIQYCQLAKQMGADIALFPEMWSIGYSFPERAEDVEDWRKKAIDQEDVFFKQYKALAKELNMAIAITYLEKREGSPRNTVSIIDRFGNCVLTYAKVHTCDFGSEAYCTPGDAFFTCDLDTEMGTVKVGAMICYDREFPESARILMLQGTEIILIPNACEMEENRIHQLKTRAFENMVGVALSNYAKGSCKGHSIAFDGMAFGGGAKDKDGVSRNTLIVEAGEEEGIYLAQFNIAALRTYRNHESWGNSYRKPKAYSMLLSEVVKEPFKRTDARR